MSATCPVYDYVLIGGGLQSGLIALAIRHHQPNASMLIVEKDDTLGGNHTWSFHSTDMVAESAAWMAPIEQSQWPSYQVISGGRERQVQIAYHSIASRHFASAVERSFNASEGRCRLLCGTSVLESNPTTVTTADRSVIHGNCVIDNRGPTSALRASTGESSFHGGFQKFWGFEVELPIDWPRSTPILMDDRVEQVDGFRFFYTLPFTPRRILIEDTRFSNHPCIDRGDCVDKVDAYLKQMTAEKVGLAQCRIVREESGVLPMPYVGYMPGSTQGPASSQGIVAGGYRGGWFHAATGYSFPLALEFANWVAQTPFDALSARIQLESSRRRHQARFARFLNRLLFELVKPTNRYEIFRRFYRVLSTEQIGRAHV